MNHFVQAVEAAPVMESKITQGPGTLSGLAR